MYQQTFFSAKSQLLNILGLVDQTDPLLQGLHSAFVIQQQPLAIHKWMGLALFQQNFIYGY